MGIAKADGIDPIAVRQAVMSMQGGDFAFIRSVVAAKGDVKPLGGPRQGDRQMGCGDPDSVFPKGTENGGDTKALPEIWSDHGRLPEDRGRVG